MSDKVKKGNGWGKFLMGNRCHLSLSFSSGKDQTLPPEIFFGFFKFEAYPFVKLKRQLRGTDDDEADGGVLFDFIDPVQGQFFTDSFSLVIGVNDVPGNSYQGLIFEIVDSSTGGEGSVFIHDEIVLGVLVEVVDEIQFFLQVKMPGRVEPQQLKEAGFVGWAAGADHGFRVTCFTKIENWMAVHSFSHSLILSLILILKTPQIRRNGIPVVAFQVK